MLQKLFSVNVKWPHYYKLVPPQIGVKTWVLSLSTTLYCRVPLVFIKCDKWDVHLWIQLLLYARQLAQRQYYSSDITHRASSIFGQTMPIFVRILPQTRNFIVQLASLDSVVDFGRLPADSQVEHQLTMLNSIAWRHHCIIVVSQAPPPVSSHVLHGFLSHERQLKVI